MACKPGGKEDMRLMTPLVPISIIGGADGPTTIYITPKWIVGMLVVFAIVLLGSVILGFSRSLKKKNKIGMFVFGLLGMIMILVGMCVIVYILWGFCRLFI